MTANNWHLKAGCWLVPSETSAFDGLENLLQDILNSFCMETAAANSVLVGDINRKAAEGLDTLDES
jgi:hypothetical protein